MPNWTSALVPKGLGDNHTSRIKTFPEKQTARCAAKHKSALRFLEVKAAGLFFMILAIKKEGL